MKPPYSLVPEKQSADTVEALERLLAEAREGALIGIAYAAIMKRRNYKVNVCGEAHRSPTFARGVLSILNDELGHRIRKGDSP